MDRDRPAEIERVGDDKKPVELGDGQHDVPPRTQAAMRGATAAGWQGASASLGGEVFRPRQHDEGALHEGHLVACLGGIDERLRVVVLGQLLKLRLGGLHVHVDVKPKANHLLHLVSANPDLHGSFIYHRSHGVNMAAQTFYPRPLRFRGTLVGTTVNLAGRRAQTPRFATTTKSSFVEAIAVAAERLAERSAVLLGGPRANVNGARHKAAALFDWAQTGSGLTTNEAIELHTAIVDALLLAPLEADHLRLEFPERALDPISLTLRAAYGRILVDRLLPVPIGFLVALASVKRSAIDFRVARGTMRLDESGKVPHAQAVTFLADHSVTPWSRG